MLWSWAVQLLLCVFVVDSMTSRQYNVLVMCSAAYGWCVLILWHHRNSECSSYHVPPHKYCSTNSCRSICYGKKSKWKYDLIWCWCCLLFWADKQAIQQGFRHFYFWDQLWRRNGPALVVLILDYTDIKPRCNRFGKPQYLEYSVLAL
jgi:hypothetical protein